MICPRCGRTYDASKKYCPQDGTPLLSQPEVDFDDDEADEPTIVTTDATLVSQADRLTNERAAKVVVHYRDPQPGDRIGEYEVQEEIGRGGMSSVYRAVHPFSGKQVAIKLLHPRLPSQIEAVARFVQEARAVQLVGHRNIIDIISFEQLPDGRHYFVLEFLLGMTLTEYMEREGAIPLERALPILQAVASALDAAHARGIVHRDLKPDNIFLERPDRPEHLLVKLLDFGAATLMERDIGPDDDEWLETQDGVILGTPDYMSPEQCRGDSVDQRTDVYSLGVVAYQMITGEMPFGSGGAFEVMARRLDGSPIPPSQVLPHISKTLEAAIVKALEVEPEARFHSVGAFVAAIEATLAPSSIHAGMTATPGQAVGFPPPVPGAVAQAEKTKDVGAYGPTMGASGEKRAPDEQSGETPPASEGDHVRPDPPPPPQSGSKKGRLDGWIRNLFGRTPDS